MTVKVNYLTNKELLIEIHKSKMSYCSMLDPSYGDYDMIITDFSEITDEKILEAKEKKAAKIKQKIVQEMKQQKKKFKVSDIVVDLDTIKEEDIVWRYMTDEHIPVETRVKKRRRIGNSDRIKTNFPAFKHFIIRDGEFVEVVRSHWVGGFENGYYTMDEGKMTRRLAYMFTLLVDRYSRRSNWRGYSYVSEMCGQALLQLAHEGLQFNESRSENPFAFYTQIVKTSFTKVLNSEKRNQTIRDDLLIHHGSAPSFSRQLDDYLVQRNENM